MYMLLVVTVMVILTRLVDSAHVKRTSRVGDVISVRQVHITWYLLTLLDVQLVNVMTEAWWMVT